MATKYLIVDDSSIMRTIITRSLPDIGLTPVQAGNGKEALAALAPAPGDFALILLDWNMPEMNGLDTLKAVKADPATKGIPVVMVTTEADKACVVQAASNGAIGYVTKPFEASILASKVNRALGR